MTLLRKFEELFTVTEASKILGYTTAGVRKAIRERRMEAIKKGKCYFIEERSIRKFSGL
jgi:excisionase family DNA binding protein